LLLKDNPNINQKILLKQIMKEWERKEISDKANYNFKAEEDKKRFKKQLKEFEKKDIIRKEMFSLSLERKKKKKPKKRPVFQKRKKKEQIQMCLRKTKKCKKF
jgi:hypothetical protein